MAGVISRYVRVSKRHIYMSEHGRYSTLDSARIPKHTGMGVCIQHFVYRMFHVLTTTNYTTTVVYCRQHASINSDGARA